MLLKNVVIIFIIFISSILNGASQYILAFDDFYFLQDSTRVDDIEIEGIVVDATQTKIGKDFYDIFYQQWNQVENLPYHSITINEKALPQLGSQITVQIEDQLIFQQIIQPRYEVIEQMANYAVQRAYQYVQNYDDMQKQLQGEDLEGTGIY
jgi:curli production assembly/transport component CsgE